MSQLPKVLSVLICGITLMHLFESCNKETDQPTLPMVTPVVSATDEELFIKSDTLNGFVWYKLSDQLYNKSTGTGHSPPFFRTRFNAMAATMLDSVGTVKPGTIFPEGSLIVKELREANYLVRYAVMYKNTGDKNADSRGWLWAYLNPDGSIGFSVSNKGSQCVTCHSQEGNADGVLMGKFYP